MGGTFDVAQVTESSLNRVGTELERILLSRTNVKSSSHRPRPASPTSIMPLLRASSRLGVDTALGR
jgi:hypothetical protein